MSPRRFRTYGSSTSDGRADNELQALAAYRWSKCLLARLRSLSRIILTMEFESMAAAEAYTYNDKGEEVNKLHKEASKHTVQGTMAYDFYRVLE